MTRQAPSLSFEFFPPATDAGAQKLLETHRALQALQPEYFSVTFGAGGSTQARTVEAVTNLTAAGSEVAPHLTCVGATRDSIRELLDGYRAQGVRRLVALRGDLPSGTMSLGDFQHATDLVRFVREHSGDWFTIEVAAYPEMHPQATSPDTDLAHFVEKVAAGADSAITQYFYNADAYFNFVERARAAGVTIPIVPGIMPILNYTQLSRFSDNCGAEIPRWIRLRLAAFHDDMDSLRAFGHDVVVDLCDRLLAGGAPGIHFYTMNQAGPCAAIWQALKRCPSPRHRLHAGAPLRLTSPRTPSLFLRSSQTVSPSHFPGNFPRPPPSSIAPAPWHPDAPAPPGGPRFPPPHTLPPCPRIPRGSVHRRHTPAPGMPPVSPCRPTRT